MKYLTKTATVALLALLWRLMTPQEACAYIDPSTGSYIIQIVIAALIGGLFVIKQYYVRIKAFFAGLSSKGKDQNTDAR